MSPSYPAPFGRPVSTADRERAEGWLKDAYADGRIDDAELDRRLGQVMTARNGVELAASCTGLVPLSRSLGAALPRPAVTRGAPLASVAHFSALFTWIVGPWLCHAVAAPGSFARREAAKAFNFQVIATVALVVTVILGGVFFDGVLGTVLPLGWLAWFLLTVYGGVKAARGQDWRNPVTRLVRWEVLDEARR